LLVRHPAVLVPLGVCYGRLDVPLAPGWEELADGLGRRLRELGVRRVVSSPLSRCRAVAERALGRGIEVDARLREMDFGVWEGVAWDLVDRALLDRWAGDVLGFAPPGGESGAALVARVVAFWEGLGEGGVCVVTHGGPLRVLGALARGEAVRLDVAAPGVGSVEVFG